MKSWSMVALVVITTWRVSRWLTSKSLPFCSQIAVAASKLAFAKYSPDGDQAHGLPDGDNTLKVTSTNRISIVKQSDI